MQRFLADGSFLRVYLALALALLLTFALALMGLALVDHLRTDQYREQLAEAPLRLLSWRVAALPEHERGDWLTQQSDALDMQLRSEERRVGKERRTQRTDGYERKKNRRSARDMRT